MLESHDLYRLLSFPPFLIFGGALVFLVVMTIARYAYKWRRAELDAMLKLEMLKRGMSADEILQVLSASGNTSTELRREQIRDSAPAHPY